MEGERNGGREREREVFLPLKYTCSVNYLFIECLTMIILHCTVFSYLHSSFYKMNLAVSQASASLLFLLVQKKKYWGQKRVGVEERKRKDEENPPCHQKLHSVDTVASPLLVSILFKYRSLVNPSQVV